MAQDNPFAAVLPINREEANPGPVVTTTFPHDELLAHRWKGRLVIDVERCVDDIMRRVDRGGGELWSHRLFRVPAVLQAIAPGTYDRFLV